MVSLKAAFLDCERVWKLRVLDSSYSFSEPWAVYISEV